jgi:beta-glucosidase
MGGISPWYNKLCSEECGGYTLNTPFAPAYPFGFGLDYLSVTFGSSSVVVDTVNQFVNATLAVNNAAARPGAKTVQLYFSQTVARYTRYNTMLAGWQKVNAII